MNYNEQQKQFLSDRIEALQRHHENKMDQAMRIIKKLRKANQKSNESEQQQLIG